ncbi:MAG TPA: hypothetical protein VGQ24_14915 [Gemmatimonadales bacterium]|nr:hypothetical protein [Gemmatimonadales bacterium]
MRLRDYNRSGALSDERAKGLGLKARIAGATAVAVVLIAGGATLAIKGRAAAVPTNPDTLCPTQRPPSEITVILLDVSDRISEPQRLQIQNQLSRLRDSIPRFGLVEVYTVDRLRRRVTEPVSHLCNPGTGADLSKIYQNPQLAKKKWDSFAAKLRTDINHQIEAPAHATSPIFEAIQATALRTFGKPDYDGLPKHLVIVSDLLQHVPGGLSMYEGVPSFESFKNTPYFSRVRSDLEGVSVLVYYLVRPGVKEQDRKHIGFWEEYFQAQGADVESVDKVFGDK